MTYKNSSRILNWDGCLNIRDLGGLALDDQTQTAYGAFVRADTLSKLTPKGRDDLVEAGVTTIVDLREPDEAAGEHYEFMGNRQETPRYLNLPLFYLPDRSILKDLDLPPRPTTIPAIISQQYYIGLDLIFPEQVREIISAMAAVESGSIVFHCQAGKDRTGVIAALLLAIAGVSAKIIAADYAETAVHLKPQIDEWLAEFEEGPEREKRALELASEPEMMLAVLDYFEQKYGSVVEYLLEIGVTKSELVRIRERLCMSSGRL